jgi:hypothetical protein
VFPCRRVGDAVESLDDRRPPVSGEEAGRTASYPKRATATMHATFSATVSALVYSLIDEHCPAAGPIDRALNNRVVQFILDQHGRMPDYLRLPLVLLTVVFDLSSIPRHFRRFHRLSPELRRQQIRTWKQSRLSVRRDLMRFYDTLAVFGWYAQVEENKGVRQLEPGS